jgi:hypothetical protein
VGHNKLGQVVRRVCEKAGIKGNFTNHSLRATTATRGLSKGIPDARSLQTYQRPSTSSKIEISKAFDCVNSFTTDEKCGEKFALSRKRIETYDNCDSLTKVRKLNCDESVGTNSAKKSEVGVSFSNCTFVVKKNFSC